VPLESPVTSVEDLIGRILTDTDAWQPTHPRRFRGEPDSNTPLLPPLYRKLPFVPPYVHPRMAAQQSRFTIHGRKKVSLSALLPNTILKSYRIDPKHKAKLGKDLRMLGVGHAVAFQTSTA
jgi:hypothetical protein